MPQSDLLYSQTENLPNSLDTDIEHTDLLESEIDISALDEYFHQSQSLPEIFDLDDSQNTYEVAPDLRDDETQFETGPLNTSLPELFEESSGERVQHQREVNQSNAFPSEIVYAKKYFLYLTADQKFYAFDVDHVHEDKLGTFVYRFNALVWEKLKIKIFDADYASIRVRLPAKYLNLLWENRLANPSSFQARSINFLEFNLPEEIRFSFHDLKNITANFYLAERAFYYVLYSSLGCQSQHILCQRLNRAASKHGFNFTLFEIKFGMLLLDARLYFEIKDKLNDIVTILVESKRVRGTTVKAQTSPVKEFLSLWKQSADELQHVYKPSPIETATETKSNPTRRAPKWELPLHTAAALTNLIGNWKQKLNEDQRNQPPHSSASEPLLKKQKR